jgi:hypothetical protein
MLQLLQYELTPKLSSIHPSCRLKNYHLMERSDFVWNFLLRNSFSMFTKSNSEIQGDSILPFLQVPDVTVKVLSYLVTKVSSTVRPQAICLLP